MDRIDRLYVKNVLPYRDPCGHKGTFGKVLCICGSVGYTGAPIFASRAAVRTGSGLVFLAVPESIWPVAAVKSDEAMPFSLSDVDGKLHGCFKAIAARSEGCDAVLYGCGLGRSDALDELVRDVLTLPQPLVLDADGINALAGHTDVLKRRRGITVLTPHEGEFVRLAGDIGTDRRSAAENLARELGAMVVLKGHGTIITDGTQSYRNPTGNPGMAVGGSGDVLAGVVVSLLGQGIAPLVAAATAVWLHGAAGDVCAEKLGQYAMLPTDILEELPRLMK
jgi:NAD(P)H-hydrate epimerase